MYTRIGFQVLTTVITKSSIFWDITPCSPLKVNRPFGVTYCLHLQGRRISWARNQSERKSWFLQMCTFFGSKFSSDHLFVLSLYDDGSACVGSNAFLSLHKLCLSPFDCAIGLKYWAGQCLVDILAPVSGFFVVTDFLNDFYHLGCLQLRPKRHVFRECLYWNAIHDFLQSGAQTDRKVGFHDIL
jgi:hypothetical protein